MKTFKVGDRVTYLDVLNDDPDIAQGPVYTVMEVHPKGIPSYPKPMLKLEGKAGLVAASHCWAERTSP